MYKTAGGYMKCILRWVFAYQPLRHSVECFAQADFVEATAGGKETDKLKSIWNHALQV